MGRCVILLAMVGLLSCSKVETEYRAAVAAVVPDTVRNVASDGHELHLEPDEDVAGNNIYRISQRFEGTVFQDEKQYFSFNITSSALYRVRLSASNPQTVFGVFNTDFKEISGFQSKNWVGDLEPGRYRITVKLSEREADKKGAASTFELFVKDQY